MNKLKNQETSLKNILSDTTFILDKCPEAQLKIDPDNLSYYFIIKNIVNAPEHWTIKEINRSFNISFFNTFYKDDGSKIKVYNKCKQVNIANLSGSNQLKIDFSILNKSLITNNMADKAQQVIFNLLNRNKEITTSYDVIFVSGNGWAIVDATSVKTYKDIVNKYLLLK